MNNNFDIIVVGGGHAGIEAALISSKLLNRVLLITINKNKIGFMHCNPSIGGSAKGVVVKEIDVLGGEMARAADKTALQFKLLNVSSGLAIQSLRVQSDKIKYSNYMKNLIENNSNITIKESIVSSLILENNVVKGVILENGEKFFSKAVILTTGTYLSPLTYRGKEKKKEGPGEEKFLSSDLSDNLLKLGFKMKRFKTGTSPRIFKDTIDYSQCSLENGSDLDGLKFSFRTNKEDILPYDKQKPCYLIHSNSLSHKIVEKNKHLSPIYYEEKIGTGPRYCPSFEDKISRFPGVERHQIFLEPESIDLDTIYIQGLSTSLPIDVQDEILRTLPGLKNCKVKT
jgi:tRNA uridine 5-carboxymethylaminomethyl modification enzyme